MSSCFKTCELNGEPRVSSLRPTREQVALETWSMRKSPEKFALKQLLTFLFSRVRVNPEKGAEFATQLANGELVDIERVVDIFQSQGMVQAATAFLLDALKDNKPEQGHLQTRLLEMNLMNAPQVADAILGNDMFSHFDRARIAQLCEQAGLSQKALELYDDPEAIKRVIINIVATPNFSQGKTYLFAGFLPSS